MGPQREWTVYNAGALKPQPSRSAEVAATLLMQTTWQEWMYVETSEVCGRSIESLLRV